jgi:hypothetical protein
MKNMEEKLSRYLYRAFCPTSSELGEYQLGMLSPERQAAIREHLQECPLCTQELEQLRGFLQETSRDVEFGPLERARVLVARLLESKGGPGMAPALQGLRGHAEKLLTYEADGAQVILDIQDDPDRKGLMAVMGLVIATETGQLEASLQQAGGLIASAPVDEFGNFKLFPIPPGKYVLVLSSPAVEIHIEDLVLE